MASRGSRLSRRSVLASLLAVACGRPVMAQSGIVFVSRERLLREIAASQTLRAAETEMTQRLQTGIDAAQAQLAGEEQELARLRAELPAEEFEARAADFDQRIRSVRRVAQDKVNQLTAGFQQARAEIVSALPRILEQVRLEAGATMVLNGDQALALDPSADRTARAIEIYDAAGPRPTPPSVDLDSPLLPPAASQPDAQQ